MYIATAVMYIIMLPTVRTRDVWLKTFIWSEQNNLLVSPGPVCYCETFTWLSAVGLPELPNSARVAFGCEITPVASPPTVRSLLAGPLCE